MTGPGEEKFEAAVRLHQSGDYRAALQSYLPLLDNPILGPDVACNLSALSLQMGDVAESERYARHSLARKPGHANGWNHLGLALRGKGDAAGAAQAFQRAVSLDAGHAQAYSNLAEILADRDDIPVPALLALAGGEPQYARLRGRVELPWGGAEDTAGRIVRGRAGAFARLAGTLARTGEVRALAHLPSYAVARTLWYARGVRDGARRWGGGA